MKLRRYAPLLACLAISGAWANYSIRPTVEQMKVEMSGVVEFEAKAAEWAWVDTEALPAEAIAAPVTKSGVPMKRLTSKVSACRISLARFGGDGGEVVGGVGGASRFEVRGKYPCVVSFLESVASDPCELARIRKNADGTLLAALSMRVE